MSQASREWAFPWHNDFVGVKVGDVNSSAKANTNQILPRNGKRVSNQPNFWNAQTVIRFELPENASDKLTVFDVNGKAVRTLEGDYKAGYDAIILSV